MNDTRPTGLRAAQKQFTKERLVEAAIRVFSSVGFRAATIDMITREVGASRTTFYLHFRDKTDIANEIGDRLIPGTEAQFRELDAMERPSLDAVADWLRRGASVTRDNRTLVAVATEANVSDPALTADYYDLMGRYADCMRRHLARFDPAARAAARMRLLLQIVQTERAFFVAVVRGGRIDPTPVMDALALNWWRLLNEPFDLAGSGSAEVTAG